MTTEFIISDHEHNTAHQFKITLAKNTTEMKALYKYRYSIYLKYGLIEQNNLKIDKDNYDDHCHHIVATFDDKIIGTLRVIHGNVIPTLDYYYNFDTSMPLLNYPRSRIFEVGRIIATPHIVTHLMSSHFILLMMFEYVVTFTKKHGLDMSIGAMKKRIVNQLERVKFPIHTITNANLVYNPHQHHDPLTLFFNEHKTGKICPVFIGRKEAETYFSHVRERLVVTKNVLKS